MSWASNFTFSMPSWVRDSSQPSAQSNATMPSAAEIEAERVSLRILDEMTPYVQAYPGQSCANLKRQWGVSGNTINLRFPWMKCDD